MMACAFPRNLNENRSEVETLNSLMKLYLYIRMFGNNVFFRIDKKYIFKFYLKSIMSKSVISYMLTIKKKLQILNYLIIAVDEQYELYKIILISTGSGIIVYNKLNKEI